MAAAQKVGMAAQEVEIPPVKIKKSFSD